MPTIIKFIGGPHEGELIAIPELWPNYRFLVLDDLHSPRLYENGAMISGSILTKEDVYERWRPGDGSYLYIYRGRQ
jgi:hypothetical protein